MKNFRYIIFLLVFLSTSCSKDFLDKNPLDSVTNNTYWKTEDQLRAALYPCYDGFKYELIMYPDIFGGDVNWGDLSSGLSKIPGGTHTALDGFPISSFWNYTYNNIFTCNNFLDHYDAAEIDQDVKDSYAAEVKVIRALQYFWLASYYGDVPLIKKVISSSEAYGPRNSRGEVVEFILKDLDWAAEKLGSDIPTGNDLGRINRWGALALKARIALQNEMWEIAASTSKEIIDNSPYELYGDYLSLYRLDGDTEVNPANKEPILFSLYVEDVRMHNLSGYICKPVDYVRYNPSRRLVDAYLCSDGKPAKKGLEYRDQSGVKLSDLYTYPEQHYTDYFADRDPRMSLTLYTPGDDWPGGDDGDPDEDISNPVFNLPRFAALQSNNRLGANSLTGFYFKKYNNPEIATSYNRDYGNINVIRYAEILLIYAEAQFNMQGETLTQGQIDMTINKLRDRVGMHHMILAELGAWGMDLKTELHRERRVEMSLDGMRYFDILRWKEGEKMLGKAVIGPHIDVCQNDLGANPFPDNGLDEFGNIIFEKSEKQGGLNHFDPSKHYLWPVPYVERNKNENLGQNPGW